jgi:DNA repair exonuclease SbcCD ATPase subunit
MAVELQDSVELSQRRQAELQAQLDEAQSALKRLELVDAKLTKAEQAAMELAELLVEKQRELDEEAKHRATVLENSAAALKEVQKSKEEAENTLALLEKKYAADQILLVSREEARLGVEDVRAVLQPFIDVVTSETQLAQSALDYIATVYKDTRNDNACCCEHGSINAAVQMVGNAECQWLSHLVQALESWKMVSRALAVRSTPPHPIL